MAKRRQKGGVAPSELKISSETAGKKAHSQDSATEDQGTKESVTKVGKAESTPRIVPSSAGASFSVTPIGNLGLHGAGAIPTARDQRIKLIKELEKKRGSRIITYLTGDRQGAPQTQIGDDVIRPMYDHVRKMGNVEKIDLYLYSHGGAVEVPWRIVSMLRQHCNKLSVLIPYHAHSAATLIAIGCDEIQLGKKAELGPIDPAVSLDRGTEVREQIRVEDVMSFIRFIKEVAGLGDQKALADNVRILTEKLSPPTLGSIYRTHTHIRMVAQKMLACHSARMDEQKAARVVESLAEKIYSHGHAIGFSEAKDIGLPVHKASEEIDEMMWQLFESYEACMELRRPIDHFATLGVADDAEIQVILAMLETSDRTTAFRGTLKLRKLRQQPNQVQVNLTLGLQLPPNIDPATMPKEFQEALNAWMKNVQAQIPALVQDQTKKQSPIIRIEGRLENPHWQDVTLEGI